MEPIEFLMKTCHVGENDNINYEPYEHGRNIQVIHIKKAVEMLENDIEDMKEFLTQYHLESKAKEATFRIWKKHLIVFDSKK